MIKKICVSLLIFVVSATSFALFVNTKQAFAATVTPCPNGTFLGLPSWHKHLEGKTVVDPDTGVSSCTPQISGLNDIWKIVAAVLEMLLRLATLIAIGFVVYGGILYTTSQGSPDKTKQALNTIISALVGLVISIVSASVVSFIAGRF